MMKEGNLHESDRISICLPTWLPLYRFLVHYLIRTYKVNLPKIYPAVAQWEQTIQFDHYHSNCLIDIKLPLSSHHTWNFWIRFHLASVVTHVVKIPNCVNLL